jgi:hypothetical protein
MVPITLKLFSILKHISAILFLDYAIFISCPCSYNTALWRRIYGTVYQVFVSLLIQIYLSKGVTVFYLLLIYTPMT